MLIESVITCPYCGTAKAETMPTNACPFRKLYPRAVGGIVLCRGAANAAVADAMVNAIARRTVTLIGSL
jgi:hypothetical protein